MKKITNIYLWILTFLLPLKFGTLALMPETAPYIPKELWEYIIVNFSSYSLGVFAGVGVILSIISYGDKFKLNKIKSIILYSWLALIGISFLGIINASTVDYIYLTLGHISGYCIYFFAIFLWLEGDEQALNSIKSAISCGAIVTMILGLHQYFFGFDEQIKFYQENAGKLAGKQFDLTNKINERRVFSTLGGCNVFAGYLLLIFGISWQTINKWAENFQPVKISKIIFNGLFLLSWIFLIYQTGSRGAILAVAVTIGFWVIFSLKIKIHYKVLLVLLIILIGTSGIIASSYFGRTFGSFTERIGYIKNSFIMMYNHPFAGTGWGDFFIDNMFYRTILENEEARTPHNVWLFFGSQAGVFALLIAMIATFYPIYLTIKSKENFLIMVSLIAFSIHSMIDVNSQISANMALYSVMLFMGARGVKNENFKWQLPKVIINTLLIIIAIASIILNLYNIVCEKRFDDFLNEVQPANNQLPNIYKVNMAYQKINKLKPFSPFHNASMYNFCLNFDKSSALTYLDKAIKNSPERASYYAQKAFYFQNINRMDSLKNIKKALYLYPLNTKYLQFLSDLEQ